MAKKVEHQAITVDGSRWELKPLSTMDSVFGTSFAWARPMGTEGEFNWRIYLAHIVARRDVEWEEPDA